MEPLKYIELNGRSFKSLNDALENAIQSTPNADRNNMVVLETYACSGNDQTTYQIKLKLAAKEPVAYV
jgi:flavin-binding protein dodecin